MSDKTFKIVDGDISDGYHTFDELYEHRCLLYLTWLVLEYTFYRSNRDVRWCRDHFPGWDLVGTNIGSYQISYHVPEKYRPILAKFFKEYTCDEMEKVFDGHTAKDVAQRLEDNLFDFVRWDGV